MKSTPFYRSRVLMAALASALTGSAEYVKAITAAEG